MSRRASTVLLALGCATAVVVGSASFGAAGSQALSGDLSGARTVAAGCPSAGGVKIAEARTPSAAVKVYGHGWGHGMGMSQYGAQGAARLGCGYRTILDTYYHDSSVVTRALNSNVLLALAADASGAKLAAETGSVHWVAGAHSAVQPKGSTWKVSRRTVGGVSGLALFDQAGTRKLFVPDAAVLTARHSGVVVTVHPTGSGSSLRTRWDSARFVGSPTGVVVSEVIGSGHGYTAVQKYLMGLGEVPVSWPVEALKAQVVAARTYLTQKYSAAAGAYVVRITTADQVYRGYDQEQKDAQLGGSWHRAVVATAGQVIVDSAGRIIDAMYSSSAGGYTENRQYVYGSYGISYLTAVDDSRWDNASDNPYRRWSQGFSTASLAKRFGFQSVSAWSVAKRGSLARLSGVWITGERKGKRVTVAFSGTDARSRLRLRSPGFVFGPVPKGKPVPVKPVPTPTPTSTLGPTPSPTVTPTATPTVTSIATPTPLVSPTPTATATPPAGLRKPSRKPPIER